MPWHDDAEGRAYYQSVARETYPAAVLKVGSLFGRPFALGPLQLYPKNWSRVPTDTMAHEGGHNATYEALGWLVPIAGWFFGRGVRAWCGVPFFLLLYYVLPLPVGLAVFRCWFELIADRRTWRLKVFQRAHPHAIRARASAFGKVVNHTKAYGWALPWIGPWWYRRACEKVLR